MVLFTSEGEKMERCGSDWPAMAAAEIRPLQQTLEAAGEREEWWIWAGLGLDVGEGAPQGGVVGPTDHQIKGPQIKTGDMR